MKRSVVLQRFLVVGSVLAVLVTGMTFWTVADFPVPATQAALAANTKDDLEWRLARWEERRDRLYEKRDGYKDKRQPLPTWLRSSIRSACKQITVNKRRLRVTPVRCDD